MLRYLTRVRIILYRLAVGHAVSAGSPQVRAVLKFVIARTIEFELENLNEWDDFGDTSVDEGIILKWIFRIYDTSVCTGQMWLWKGPANELL
jgi:hypothetical protein